MKGLKKVALASAIAAVSAGAQAELKALDDSAMGELTGQSGLTIDIETRYTIGEFMYTDEGSVFFKNISLGGSTSTAEAAFAAATGNTADAANGLGTYVDNIRLKLDVAGAGESLDYGFSRVRDLAGVVSVGMSNNGGDATEASDAGVASATGTLAASYVTGLVESSADLSAGTVTSAGEKTYDDGDLVIHVSFKDAFQKLQDGTSAGFVALNATGAFGSATFGLSDYLEQGVKSVDFNFAIDAIGLAASTVAAGETVNRNLMGHTATGLDNDGADTTVLISDLNVNGYLGVLDINIENDGNGFEDNYGGAENYGAADSKIEINQYIDITDLDVYLDIAGVDIQDLKINNKRGDVTDLTGNFALGFAQTERTIYAVKDTAGFSTGASVAIAAAGAQTIDAILQQGKDGVAIDTRFKGDMEIGYLGFGDTDGSIGELYWTDITSDSKWTISAH